MVLSFFDRKYENDKQERLLHEKDAQRNIQIQQTKGLTGFFYRMYINDSRKFAATFKGKNILDIGAGDGIILGGVELNPIEIDISIERCLRLKEKQTKVVCGSGFNLPIKSHSIDCALLIAILEHTSRPRLVIDEVYRILKIGGEAGILIPNDITMSIGRLLQLKFPPRYPGHISFITPNRLKEWLNGRFEVVNQYNLPFHKISFWLSLYHFVYLKKR